ncbi:MAG: hypothetical protein HY436_01365, partial [Candidatus Liptonbacteria bacterium]|nr:hypothetical protein [Candidatus Liptonbacteria bacterium]
LSPPQDPAYTLDLNGGIRLWAVTPPAFGEGVLFYDGLKFKCAEDGDVAFKNCIGAGGGVGGSGTANRVAKFTAGTTIGDSQITDDGTNVGIGSAPSYRLDVQGGDINTSGVFRKSGTAGITTLTCPVGQTIGAPTVSGGILTAGSCVSLGGGGVTTTGSPAATQVAYFSGGSTITGESNLYWDETNNRLGIGTASPAQTLDVAGPAHLRGTGAGPGLFVDSIGNVGIGNTGPSSKLTVTGEIYATLGGVRFPDNTVQTTAWRTIGARVYHSTTQTIATNVSVPLSFDLKEYNVGGVAGAGTVDRLTAPVAGKYLIVGHAQFLQDNAVEHDRGYRFLRIAVTRPGSYSNRSIATANGPGMRQTAPGGGTGVPHPWAFSISATYELQAGDYVQLQAFSNQLVATGQLIGGPEPGVSGRAGPAFSMQWIGP